MKNKKRINITVDPDVHREAAGILKGKGVSLSSWIERAMKALVKRESKTSES